MTKWLTYEEVLESTSKSIRPHFNKPFWIFTSLSDYILWYVALTSWSIAFASIKYFLFLLIVVLVNDDDEFVFDLVSSDFQITTWLDATADLTYPQEAGLRSS